MARGGEGIYSATYSGIPVYEFQFGPDLKEHVMRRRQDDWINATHILKAAGFDKPARTRILEREVQKDVHEKIQGGYGKYQGTWIPLEHGDALAQRNNVYDRLRPIFEFQPGDESPPPAPRHTSKPKAPRAKPAVPKWNRKSSAAALSRQNSVSQRPPGVPLPEEFDHADAHLDQDDTPDNLTVASASYMAEEDRYDMSHYSTGHRKRKREDMIHDLAVQQHAVYGDELLDYFLLSRNEQPAIRPDPPTNFQPDWPIDSHGHNALHWASAMGDVDVIKQLKRFGASVGAPNVRGETPLMRAVCFTNCYEKDTFAAVARELFATVDARDASGCTVIHHAAVMKSGRFLSHSCSRYYLDHLLNRLLESHEPSFCQQLIDARDNDGNTAVHLAAQRDARKCIRALLGRGASTDIPNAQGVRAEDLIRELNAHKSQNSSHKPPRAQRSSSPFAPDSQRHAAAPVAPPEPHDPAGRLFAAASAASTSYQSEAAGTVQSRITPLVLEKFQDLAQSYEDEFREKDDAEKEARRILLNTQAELANLRAAIADLEGLAEPPDAAEKVAADVGVLRKQALAYVTHQNRIAVQEAVEQELGMMMNGSSGDSDTGFHDRLRLAAELQTLLRNQRQAEADYVEARAMLGAGENIDKYRRLLKSCLGPSDQDMLDANLDDLIRMMEEETDVAAGGGEPMEIAPV